jgi:hypothetical protein
MAKLDKDLYKTIRKGGVRKGVARRAAEASRSTGNKAPKQLKKATKDLRSALDALEDRVSGGPQKRKEAAKKAARTRKRKANERSAAAKKAAKTRARAN